MLNPSVLKNVLLLAALLHDLGKANRQFQINKFKIGGGVKKESEEESASQGSDRAERWRHELISVIMVHHVLTQDGHSPASDIEGLDRLMDFEGGRWRWPSEADFKAPLFGLDTEKLEKSSHPALQFVVNASSHPLLSTVCWLVLSHHRLPGWRFTPDKSQSVFNEEFTNLMNPTFAPREECVLASGEAPWGNPRWRERVRDVVQHLLADLKDSVSGTDAKKMMQNWALMSTHFLRPLLISGDHIASCTPVERTIQPKTKRSKSLPAAMYANTHDNGDLGDSLTTHLCRVEKLGLAMWNLIDDSNAPVARIPDDSVLKATNVPSPFQWQIVAEQQLAQKKHDRPTFVAVIAETGSGKTLGGARILAALSGGEIRATFAFGMRSITLQTGQELFGADLSHQDVSVLVGNPASRLIFEKSRKERRDAGSESAAGDWTFDIAEDSSKRSHLNWVQEAMNDGVDASTSKERRPKDFFTHDAKGLRLGLLLSQPIIACTVDHLIHGLEAERSGESLSALRAMTADLLLDELDAYSAKDLISLNKLVLLHGIAGRNVVIMSATLSPVVAESMFKAWKDGVSLRESMLGKKVVPRSAVVFNADPYVVMPSAQETAHPATEAEFRRQWEQGVNHLLKTLSMDKQRRHFDVLPLPLPHSEDSFESSPTYRSKVWEAIATGAQGLHRDNYVSVKERESGKSVRVSVGFVRFNTARNAARYTKWALQADSPALANTRVLAYHSKYPLLHLSLIEEKLNTLLARKNGNENFVASDWIQRHLTNAAGELCEDVVIMVATTTLNETGRDHDYDWCINEPRSVRGEVQAVGRVRRHRPEAYNNKNVLFMEQSLRSLSKSNLPWAFPGVETLKDPHSGSPAFKVRPSVDQYKTEAVGKALTILGIKDDPARLSSNKPVIKAGEGLPLQLWEEKGFTAAPCLLRPEFFQDSPVGAVEMVEQFAFLESNETFKNIAIPSALEYRESAKRYAWFRAHAHQTRFRKNDTSSDGLSPVFLLKDPLAKSMEVYQPQIGKKNLGKKNLKGFPVTWIDSSFPETIHAERVFWRAEGESGWSIESHNKDLDGWYNELASGLGIAKEKGPLRAAALLGIEMRPGDAGTPDKWKYEFHPLLGLFKR